MLIDEPFVNKNDDVNIMNEWNIKYKKHCSV